jgi:1-acyl-sn-glycerol-3-phosphate acyltransferase
VSAPVGNSRADDRPWRKGAYMSGVKDRVAKLPKTPSELVPQKMKGFPFTAPTVPRNVELPPDVSKLGMNFDTDWAQEPVPSVARRIMQESVVRGSVRALTSPTIDGLDRLVGLRGPIIFAANHHSHLDIAMLLVAMPSRFRRKTTVAAAADYFFDKRWKSIVSSLTLNAIPIERHKVSRNTSDRLLQVLADGMNLVIFPEGGRSPDGWAQEFKPGAAFLSVRRNVPIVPVHIEGTDEVLPKGSKLPKRHRCTVTFGLPLTPHEGEDARDLNARLAAAVNELADEHRTNWWSARRNAAQDTTPSLGAPAMPAWRKAWAQTDRKAKRDVAKESSAKKWPRN